GNAGATIRNTILNCQPASGSVTVGTTAIVFGWAECGGKLTKPYSHAEGKGSTASGDCAHAEGINTTASGNYASHSEGFVATASGYGSHCEGWYSTAS